MRLRAERIGALHEQLYLAAETELSAVLGHIEQVNPTLLILDSVQTVRSPSGDGTDGGATQVRAVASALTAVSKNRGMTTILVGHVTPDGAIPRPRTLQHLVDVVISFDGERHSTLRLIRAVKNQFAPPTSGCFEIGDDGRRRGVRPLGPVRVPPLRARGRQLRHDHPGGQPTAPGGGPGAGRELDRRRVPPVAPSADWTPSASRWSTPSSNAGAGLSFTPRPTSSPHPSGVCASPSPRPISPWPWQSPRRRRTARCPRAWWPSARSGCPARSAVSAAPGGGWPRPRGRATRSALVPAGRRRRAHLGMRLIEVPDLGTAFHRLF